MSESRAAPRARKPPHGRRPPTSTAPRKAAAWPSRACRPARRSRRPAGGSYEMVRIETTARSRSSTWHCADHHGAWASSSPTSHHRGSALPAGDPRRDSGFTLYYYGINLGPSGRRCSAAISGRGTAGTGASAGRCRHAAGLIVFVLGKAPAAGQGRGARTPKLKRPVVGPVNREWLVYLAGLVGVAVVYFIVPNHDLVGTGPDPQHHRGAGLHPLVRRLQGRQGTRSPASG
jgi:hypothetical protein